MTRVKSVVSSNLSPVKPGAKRRVMGAAKHIPRPVKMISRPRPVPKKARIMRLAARGRRARYGVSTGTKAASVAPSPTRRRSRLGIRNATKNASAPRPAPKTEPITISRPKPAMRLSSVSPPICPTARTTWAFSPESCCMPRPSDLAALAPLYGPAVLFSRPLLRDIDQFPHSC